MEEYGEKAKGEIMNKKYFKYFQRYGFNFSRCLGSKSYYHKLYPKNLIIFNARIYLKDVYKKYILDIKDFFKGQNYEIWYGDLDLTKDIYNLYLLINLELKKTIIITTECGNKIIEIPYN